jgi:hypothetical protein
MVMRQAKRTRGSGVYKEAPGECAASAVRPAVAFEAASVAVKAIDAEQSATTRQIRLLQRRRLPELRRAIEP